MSYLTIGSGDCKNLLSDIKTKGYSDLWRKFLSEDSPYYNALASPIDALRTGAILEDVYLCQLTPEHCLSQVKFTCKEMDVFTSSCDFTYFEDGNVKDIEELKTIWLTDFIHEIRPMVDFSEEDMVKSLKKKFKNNYEQLQFQLNCAGLQSGKLVFLAVKSYEDQENRTRIIEENEVIKFNIQRDEDVISKIMERGKIFQQVKDHFK